MLIKQNKRERHFGSLSEHAIRNGERCEIGYPKRCLQPREACEQSPLCTNGRLLTSCRDFQFRINRLTSNVPYAVRFVLLASLRELKVAE